MDKAAETAIAAIMAAYGKYYVEDYTTQVMGHLKASMNIENEHLQGFIAEQVGTHFSADQNIAIEAINPVTRFLHECATYAFQQSGENASDRSVYESVKNLPSIHHEENAKLVYQSAQLYQKTVDTTLLSVIVNDARIATESIAAGAQDRITQTETGGRVHQFNWGILSDGLWLNGALMKAFDLASIFRPGDPVSAYYAQVGFDFSRNYAAAPVFPGDDAETASAGFDLLLSHAENGVIADTANLLDLLFVPGQMAFAIDRWELGLKDPAALVAAVSQLTDLAIALPHLIDVAGQIEGEDLVSPIVIERLHSANNAVTLCLAAFEALRETTYAESLILVAAATNEDPTVDVFVNSDTVGTYQASGGEESDFIQLGAYLDPRKGMPSQNGGWPVSWALSRREDIVAEMMANEAERLDALRSNDAAIIQQLVQNNLRQLVTSYADASGLSEIPNPTLLKINEIARRVTNASEDASFTLEGEIVNLLINTIDDPFLTSVAARFTSFAAHEDETTRSNARALAVAATALDDAVGFLVTT